MEDLDQFEPIQVTSHTRDICSLDTYDHRPDERAPDAAFIAAANPAAVLTLCRRLRAYEAVLRSAVQAGELAASVLVPDSEET